MHLAMWSGPRNLSTALMYSFAQRPDCVAWDEPLYAAYLAETGLDHPMRETVIAAGDTDAGSVTATCCGPLPEGRSVWYQKHMCHHIPAGMPQDWLAGMTNVLLIRHPARVLASYAAKRENPTLEDIGFPQQAALFGHLSDAGHVPPVVDSAMIRDNPERGLTALCDAIGLPFDPIMLRWESGAKPYDGAWAAHWYGAVHKSTGFAGPEGPLPQVEPRFRDTLDAAMAVYEPLAAQALRA